MIRIGISGSAGRMGRALVQATHESEYTELTMALEHKGNDAVGLDAGTVSGTGELGVKITESIQTELFDVLIEFTTPEATLDHVAQCVTGNKSIVIGTTGLSGDQKSILQEASETIRIVAAPNMSVGVNLCLNLIERAAKTFGDSVDIEVIEAHHRDKVDAPSGTALKMGEVAANVLGRTLDEDGVFARHGRTGARKRSTIGFSTVRAGDIVGEHTVMFAGVGERVEITHCSNNRMNFALGAIRAAIWLVEHPPGLYEMRDVLGLN